MGANPDNITYEEQLSALEHRLKGGGDENLLGDVGQAIGNLLSRNGGSEAHIRQILERQFEQGNLRQETYELVEKLLGKIASETEFIDLVATDPQLPHVRTEVLDDEPHVQTEVLDVEPHIQTEVLDDAPFPGSFPAPGPKSPPREIQVGSQLRGRFVLQERVAEGSLGTVYKALDQRLADSGDSNPFVSIKLLRPQLTGNEQALRVLQQEAAKCRCLAHPNIGAFMDVDREDEVFFIVGEWLAGRSVAKILDDNRGNNLDLATAINIVRQCSRALTYAHQRGVVHGDVKPSNIIVTPDGHVKLVDFGVARLRQIEADSHPRSDIAGAVKGSPPYSSMQVLTGEDPAPADDVFSLACLLYRLVAGYRVFGPRSAADAALEGMEPQQPAELNEAQWQAVRKALSYSRVTRHKSAKAFMDAFGSVQATSGDVAPPQTAPQTQRAAEPVSIQQAAASLPERQSPTESTLIGADETTRVAVNAPMRAERDPIMFEGEDEAERRSPLRLIVVGTILAATAAVVLRPEIAEQLGVSEQVQALTGIVESTLPGTETEIGNATVVSGDDNVESLDALPETDIATTNADGAIEELVIDSETGTVDEVAVTTPEQELVESATQAEVTPDSIDEAAAVEAEPLPPAIDFSVLPAPAVLLTLAAPGATPASDEFTIREDSESRFIDLVRTDDLEEVRQVTLVDARTGELPDEGQLTLIDNGVVTFERGQPRARATVIANSDDAREDDRSYTLSVRDGALPDTELATIRVTLEDDDRRAFEASLSPDTVGFSVTRVEVDEFDPAVQIDISRYRETGGALEVPFTLTDVTASEGQDYFSPGLDVIYFGPGQRSARLLIPLGQDARTEQSEVFMISLETADAPTNANIFNEITVMIRDDDS